MDRKIGIESHLFIRSTQCRNFLRYVIRLIVEDHAEKVKRGMQICICRREAAGFVNKNADLFYSCHVMTFYNTKARIAPRLRQESFPHPGDSGIAAFADA